MDNGVLFRPASLKQEMFINSTSFRTIYGGSMGGGKAQPLDSKVLTVSGWKTMGDVDVGDTVVTPKNTHAKVLNTYFHKDKDIYEITTKSGRVVRACNEHLWIVTITNPKKGTTLDVIDTDEIISLKNKNLKVYLPISEAIGSHGLSNLFVDPYVMGILIAEGCLTGGYPVFTSADKEVADKVDSWCKSSGYQLTPTKDGISYRIRSNVFHNDVINSKGQFTNSNEICNYLRAIGLADKKSHNKFIPKEYLESSVAQRFELLRGLMDGYGTVSDSSSCSYTTCSEQLKNDFCYLVRSLGGIAKVRTKLPSYTYKGKKKTGRLSYIISVSFRDNRDVFYLSRKKNKCHQRKSKHFRDEIVDIKYIGKQDAKCIYIDDNEHLYLTDDFIVTHNTFMGLMRFLLYVDDPLFIGFVIRKNASDLRGAGGAFDEALDMFSRYDPKLRYTKQPMQMTFSSGAKIFFTGLDGDAGMKSLQGKQISAIMLDEATHFTEEEIVWAESRLRTKARMTPNIWLTCNPDKQSVIFHWIKDFYLYPKGTVIDGEDVGGRANPEKDGVVRYYLKVGNKTEWGDSREGLIERFGHKFPKDKTTGNTTASPKSFTFISATCLDNPPLLAATPDYVSTLASLPRATREKALYGNWLAEEEGSGYFKRDWTPLVRVHELIKTDEIVKRVRAWDLASTLPSEQNADPDYCVGVLIAKLKSGRYLIEDMVRGRWRVGELEQMLVEQTKKDIEMYGYNCINYLPVEPASAGKIQKFHFSKVFAEAKVPVKFYKVGTTKSKLDRFLPFASVSENGLVIVKEAEWNEDFFTELEIFTGSRSKNHDDIVDSCADSFNLLATSKELPKISASKLKMR